MRLKLVDEPIEDQIADMQRQVEELKTAQRTSQNSGMIAKICRSATRDSFGDIVGWSTSSNPTQVATSHIPIVATPAMNYLYNITCDQTFTPKHDKPAVAIPLLKLRVKSGGYTGETSFVMNAQFYGLIMSVRNASNTEVAVVQISQSFNDLFRPAYKAGYKYAWTTNISYASSVALELSYEFTVRSSDSGTTASTLKGSW